ncbi:LysR family transcriptional regulator [Marinomonas posidonica]|uniref:LysR family transcriptional regulator n=1 Tax=Marinomonas posidonica TaxID=936476 RepID=UPI003736FCC0
MNIEDLHTFIEVADTGGVASGARRLGLSKSIVSRRLAKLEEELGAQFFSRTTRGSVLTEAGSIFREHAVRVIAELDAAQEAISTENALMGRLRIAAPLSFDNAQLATVFAELAKRYPLLELDISYSDRFVDLVEEGFDCAVRLGILPDSSLIARRIYSFKANFVASADYLKVHGVPKTLDDLAHHQAVIRKGEVWRIFDGDKVTNVRPRGRFTSDSTEAVLAAVLAGIGITGLPDFLINKHLDSGKLVPILTNYQIPELGMYVVRPPSSFPNRKVRALIEILIEYFGD